MATNSRIEAAVSWAVGIAYDDSHGYDQASRWGLDYDCSSLVISAYEQAGVPVKTKGAIYTGNMYSVFTDCGFKDVTGSVDLSTGLGLQRGDVLLRHNYDTGDGHTAIALGEGDIVHASGNEYGGATGGRPGDQTGREICVRSYYNIKPYWQYVLRYVGAGSESQPDPVKPAQLAPVLVALPELYVGCTGTAVEMLQVILNYRLRNEVHYAPLETDGEFGRLTAAALATVQSYLGLTADAICGQQTWRAILVD